MRFYKIVFGAVLLVSIFLSNASQGADGVKIGVVDFQKIIDTSSAGKSARAEIQKKFNSLEADLKKKRAELEEQEKQLAQNALVMKKEVRDQKERELRISKNDLKMLQQEYTVDMKKLQDRLMKRIQNRVLKMVDEIGKKEGYLLILEKREGGLLYAQATIDLTDILIREYNAQFVKDSNSKKQ